MIFTSFEFILFFIAVLLIRYCIYNFSVEKWFLLIASYLFYMSWSIPCVLLILLTSLIDYFVGMELGMVEDQGRRKLLLVISVVANLGVLGFFKYTNFFLDTAWWGYTSMGFETNRWHYNIILPVGISFFTFQSMTYTIEIYRRNLKPCHNLRDFLLFVAFFPQLLAGPINRATDLLPQFKQRIRATALDFESGAAQFALGATKKLVISDRISPHVDLIFAAPNNYDGFTLLLGVLGYAIQIYCDFSGYSDMAIGAARMMGFRFMENFRMPYSAANITEFWRRWHISLSRWFRDYLYIPLGGNRKGPSRTYVNLMVTMLFCGLWHGASWNFVLWGGLHGVSLGIHRLWTAWNPLEPLQNNRWFNFAWNLASRALTLGIVLFGWIIFRTQSMADAGQYFTRLVTWSGDGTRLYSIYILSALAVVFLAHLVVHKDRDLVKEIPQWSAPVRMVAYTALLLIITSLSASDSAPFIYFQF